ncbi:ABC transporter substrate-binding protein [Desulfopila aestuarii]|uniref:Putative thiamine transport system substrate-binding protein n=1 Tax=Desulfopila aestuarii DSM 18488 TaxID=1121416 RepID=A0A1M7Y8T0_9BACT|nr:ABC transporter substrate-binding protein [Desulfopila aestuarii]SHO49027.1 putative thiamine transport system substrate-binding protein [Desulfopila aestuarii DSM 18488]
MRNVRSLLICLLLLLMVQPAWGGSGDWSAIVEKARGQKVYFNGWGGSDVINDYIRWAAEQVAERYGVEVIHVKVTDIGDVVGRILAEKSANRTSGGTVDLMWINGENFRAMKEQGLLPAPYTQLLPNYRLVDTDNKPTTMFDFTVPVENLEAPWGMAQLVFIYDSAKVTTPPKSMHELLAFAQKNPGRVTYPAPPNFHGTTFVKQVLLELTADPAVLAKPVSDADFSTVTAPLWDFLDKLHPLMWRGGKSFTSNASEMKTLLADGEIAISLTFNPNDASNAIASGELPDSVRTYVHEGGTIGNTHFLAVVFNSSNKEGAMVFADFLMSPEAQARKADPAIWGDPTVLAMDKLSKEQRKLFHDIKQGVATLSPAELGKVRLEPHTSWVEALEKAWISRYSK